MIYRREVMVLPINGDRDHDAVRVYSLEDDGGTNYGYDVYNSPASPLGATRTGHSTELEAFNKALQLAAWNATVTARYTDEGATR